MDGPSVPDTVYDLGDFICQVQAFKGQKLKDIPNWQLNDLMNALDSQIMMGGEVTAAAVAFVAVTRKYLGKFKNTSDELDVSF